jgi:hypothetical protein
MSLSWLEEALQNPPLDFTEEMIKAIAQAKDQAKVVMLSHERESGPFFLYFMGDSYSTVSEKTGWGLDVIGVTALRNHWYEKRKITSGLDDKESARKVMKEAASSMLAAVAHTLISQSRDVLSGKLDASECKMIPKNMKDLVLFMQMVSQIYDLAQKPDMQPQQPNVNVQILNNPGSPAQIQAKSSGEVLSLEAPKEESRLERFKKLKEMDGS